METLTEHGPPSGPDTISLDTLVVSPVDQHLLRSAEDAPRSPSPTTGSRRASWPSFSAGCG